MALFAGSLAGSVAQAGPPEFLESLAQHPTDPNTLILHYDAAQGGLLVSTDGGKRFDIHPGLAFTQSGLYRNHPAMNILPDGKLLVGSSWDGLFASDAPGCIKAPDLVQPGSVFDLASHPSDPAVTFFVGTKTAGGGGLWKRDAAGTITQLGPDDGAAFSAQGLAVLTREASDQQLRFVEVGLKPPAMANAPFIPAMRFSDDLGQSWTEHLIPVADNAGGIPRLLAAKGSDAVKLVVALVRDGAADPLDPVLFSTDTGASFTAYPQSFGKVGQALIAPDGRLYLSDAGTSALEGGLWRSTDIGGPLEKIADYSVNCLGYDKGTDQLYLCKAYELGRFDPASGAYCRMYQLNETVDFLCDLSTFPKISPTDQLSIAERVKQQQLCPAWCGASHYASSPFCGRYNDPKLVCGITARIYDKTPMGSGGLWEEPPNTVETRCAGFEPAAVDAGAADAGVGVADGGAGPGGDEDAGTLDAAVRTPDAGVTPPEQKSDDSCSLGQPGTRGSSLVWLTALSLLFALAARRRQRA